MCDVQDRCEVLDMLADCYEVGLIRRWPQKSFWPLDQILGQVIDVRDAGLLYLRDEDLVKKLRSEAKCLRGEG